MLVSVLRWIVILLGLLNAGYMAFDGARAFINGDYIRPKTGTYAGQLGPWTKPVEKIGIDPTSTFMKAVFVFWGVVGLIITVCFALNIPWATMAMLVYNICSLWYLFIGTASSILQIILLLIINFVK